MVRAMLAHRTKPQGRSEVCGERDGGQQREDCVGRSQVVSGTMKYKTGNASAGECHGHGIDGKGKKMRGARACLNKTKATFRRWKGVGRCLHPSLLNSKQENLTAHVFAAKLNCKLQMNTLEFRLPGMENKNQEAGNKCQQLYSEDVVMAKFFIFLSSCPWF